MPQFKKSVQNSKLKTQNFIEDFWSRQANTQTETFDFAPFGIPAKITANRPEILAAIRLSAGRFSQATPVDGQPSHIQLVVDQRQTRPFPVDLSERLVYAGVGEWITLAAGEWGHGFANLSSREAVVFLSPALAGETRFLSRYFIDHYLLNFIMTEWAMLHASCVLDPHRERLVVMIAPHNTGKSTTALHLLRAGYTFLADGMALFRRCAQNFMVGGYPTGEVKLRDDVLDRFPEYTGEPVRGREQCKTVVDLRQVHPERIVETLVTPSSIHLCFVERSGTAQTLISPLPEQYLWPQLMANTVYWDEPSQLAHNYAALKSLLEIASLQRLQIGFDIAGIISAIGQL
jgi:hypothetical protein